MNEGKRWKKKLWIEQGRAMLEKLALAPWASRRRKELSELLDRLDPYIEELTAAVEQEAPKKHCEGCDGTPSRHSLVLDGAEWM